MFYFNPGEECEGLHEVLLYSIQKSDLDLRKVLFKNIVLSGGSTLFKGFGDRLLSEIKKMSPKEIQIKVSKIDSFTKEMAVKRQLFHLFQEHCMSLVN